MRFKVCFQNSLDSMKDEISISIESCIVKTGYSQTKIKSLKGYYLLLFWKHKLN